MAIPETEPVKNHYGNNSATSFDFDFYIEKSSQLKVQHTDLNGLLTTLKENVDYSIHEIGNENGSYITFPISGSTYDILKWDTVNDKKELLTISLNIPLKQEFEFDISGDLDKHQVEKAFDYQMRVDQILNRKINRAVLVPEGSELTPTELIETLQNSKAEAIQAASDAAMSATNAQNSANLSKEQSDIASDKLNTINQKMEEFSGNYNTAVNDIQNKHSDAIIDIENILQTAEDTIIADRTEAIQAINNKQNNSISSIEEVRVSAENAVKDGIADIETTKNSAISNITTAGAEQVANVRQTGFYMQDDKLYYIDSEGETKEFKSGSSGLEVCDIGMALYVDETKGLRRYLNGQIVDANANTQAFINKLLQIKTLYPSLFCTETEWQATKTLSAFGQVGKFVLNYDDDGETVVSVRIPAIVNVQGLFDLSKMGLTVNAGLPNITGGAGNFSVAFLNNYGAFTGFITSGSSPGQTYNGAGRTATFDASASNSIYGNSNTVQQEAIQYPYFIQIATGQETETDITNETQLNNPFFLGMNGYFTTTPNNISWLKSEGQWNAKALYPDLYNWILEKYNTNSKQLYGWTKADGSALVLTESATPSVGDKVYGDIPWNENWGTVTAVTDTTITYSNILGNSAVTKTRNADKDGIYHTYNTNKVNVISKDTLENGDFNSGNFTDYDYEIDEENETFRLPLLNGNEHIPDYSNGTVITSPKAFIVPSNGIVAGVIDAGTSASKNIIVNGQKVEAVWGGATAQDGCPFYAEVKKGDSVVIGKISTSNNYAKPTFYPFVGNGTLYYYAGETIQNANLIDAGRIGEQIVDLNATSRGYLVDSYIKGTSWYRIYSDGWCEQGGYVDNTDSTGTGQRTITLLKSYKDTNYSAIVTWTNAASQSPASAWTGSLKSKAVGSFVINKDQKSYVIGYTWRASGYIS